jgi:hypothetical protein
VKGPRVAALARTVAAVIALAGCGDLLQEPDTGVFPLPIELEAVSGNGQEGAPGATLPQPLRVRVLDGGEPASRLWVEWSVVSGGGKVEPRDTFSDEDGVAEASWTLGPSGGAQRVRAVVRHGVPVVFEASSGEGP